MEINSISTYQPIKPNKPPAPTPPPGGNIENRQPPAEPSSSTSAGAQTNGASNSNGINYSALQLLQEILSDYSDVSKLGSEKQSELASRLQDAGLLKPEALVDITA